MKIENVNTGNCDARTQQGQPSFFVNWQENGENKYAFFAIRFAAEDLYQRLKKQSKTI